MKDIRMIFASSDEVVAERNQLSFLVRWRSFSCELS